MKFLFLIFVSLTLSVSAEQVHSNAEPNPQLTKDLKRVIPRFKVGGTGIKDVIAALRETTFTRDPGKPGINIIFLPKVGAFANSDPLDSGEVGDPFADEPFEDPFADPVDEGEPSFDVPDLGKQDLGKHYNFDFENMSVGEIISHIAVAGKLKYRIDKNAVVIADAGVHLKADKEWTEKFIRERLQQTNDKIKTLQQEVESLQKMLAGQKPVEKVSAPKTKMEKVLAIIIPKIRFEDRELEFAVDFFKRKTRDLSEDGDGLNIIVKVEKELPLINLDLDNMALKDLMNYMAEQLTIKYKITESAIIFYHHNELEFSKVTYDINRGFIELMTKGKELKIKERLEELGIKFRMGSNFLLYEKNKKFEMFNSGEDHEKLKKLIEATQK